MAGCRAPETPALARWRELIGVGLTVAGCLASVGCTSAATSVTARITVDHSRFLPEALTVPRGVPVALMLQNDDPIDHEWIVGDEAVHERHRTGTEPAHGDRPTEQTLPALGFKRTTVTFDTPGVYSYICHLPDHEAYGMVGTITVSSS